jgi:hypothetical protein
MGADSLRSRLHSTVGRAVPQGEKMSHFTAYEVDKSADNEKRTLVAVVRGEWIIVVPFYGRYYCHEMSGYVVELDEIEILFALPNVEQVIDLEAAQQPLHSDLAVPRGCKGCEHTILLCSSCLREHTAKQVS